MKKNYKDGNVEIRGSGMNFWTKYVIGAVLFAVLIMVVHSILDPASIPL